MNYLKLKNFVNDLQFQEYFELKGDGKYKSVKTLDFDCDFDLIKKLHKGETFNLSDENIEFIKNFIPEKFYEKDCVAFYAWNNHFWVADLKKKECTVTDYKPTFKHVFDFLRCRLNLLSKTATIAFDTLKEALDTYEEFCEYDPSLYSITVEKEVQTPNETFDYSYSLKKEEVKSMREWQNIHMKKYHKDYNKQYHGASPVSPFEVRFGICSLGSYADCFCTICERDYKTCMNKDLVKDAERIEKRMKFEVKPLDA